MTKHAPATPADNPLDHVLREQEEELRRVISMGNRWYSRLDPELLRVLGRVCGRLGEIRRHRLLRRNDADEARERKLDERLADLLRHRRIDRLSVGSAWDYERELQLALYEVASDTYIRAQIIGEWAAQHAGAHAPYGTWGKHLDVEVLDGLVKKYEAGQQTEDTHRLAVECLTFLYNERHEIGRSLTLNTSLRTRYLNGLMMMMATLLLMLLAIIYVVCHGFDSLSFNPAGFLGSLMWGGGVNVNIAHPDFQHAILAAATGALGSVLSGFYKLRDKGRYLSDLRSFRSAMAAQPFVGACIGLVLFLIIRSHILGFSFTTDGAAWAAFAIFGFIGGFSEPFFLGVVESVARKGEHDSHGGREKAAAGADDAPAAGDITDASKPA